MCCAPGIKMFLNSDCQINSFDSSRRLMAYFLCVWRSILSQTDRYNYLSGVGSSRSKTKLYVLYSLILICALCTRYPIRYLQWKSYRLWEKEKMMVTVIFFPVRVRFTSLLFFTKRHIWDWSKSKGFAEDHKNVTKKLEFVMWMVEKLMGKVEKSGYQHFLLFWQCFKKAPSQRHLKSGLCGEESRDKFHCLSIYQFYKFLLPGIGPTVDTIGVYRFFFSITCVYSECSGNFTTVHLLYSLAKMPVIPC